MQLSFAYSVISETDQGDSFEFASTTGTILLTQAGTISYGGPNSNGFALRNLADNFKGSHSGFKSISFAHRCLTPPPPPPKRVLSASVRTARGQQYDARAS